MGRSRQRGLLASVSSRDKPPYATFRSAIQSTYASTWSLVTSWIGTSRRRIAAVVPSSREIDRMEKASVSTTARRPGVTAKRGPLAERGIPHTRFAPHR